MMKGWWNNLKTWVHYVNDFILLLLLSMLTEKGEVVHILLFLVVSFICTIPINKMNLNKRTALIALFILQVILCYTLSIFSIISSILLPFFFFIVHVREDITPYHKMLGAFLWLIVSVFLHVMQMPSIWELGLFTFHALLSLWITSFNKNQKIVRFLSIAAVGTASLLFIPLIPYIRLIISYSLQWVSLGFGYFIQFLLSVTDTNGGEEVVSKIGMQNTELPPPEKAYDAFVTQAITASLIGIFAIFVIWKLYKKRKSLQLGGISFYNPSMIIPEEGMVQKQNQITRPPKNAIRKEIFKLEKKLKSPLNRQRGETVEAWMERIHTQEEVSIQFDVIIDAYNAARYSNREDTELLQQFKEEVSKLYAYRKTMKKKKK